eukprot:TRINITY_DN2729_c0_g1_i1.p1 TRINITY_DN2729_c0_g1~~TRINITY_DN2729_c0_g1_i1.p1  ORF type:complete len:426 (+),score=144.68 TRINITY_DN2729_c0_g1_i1:156-1280(+)
MIRTANKSMRGLGLSMASRVQAGAGFTSGPSRSASGLSLEDIALQPRGQGAGGRSSVSGFVATVFGATGFGGKYVVDALGKIGSVVVVPYRGTEWSYKHLKVLGDLGQIVPVQFDPCDPNSITSVISRSNVVINLIGKTWDTKNYSLNDSNNLIPQLIAAVAKEKQIKKLIHVSALGASPDSPSEWARTKYAGEEGVREVFPEATIIRPSTLYGYDDRLLYAWSTLTRYWPFIPDLGSDFMNRRIAPVYVGDFAAAILETLRNPDCDGRTFELGGGELTNRELVEWVRTNLHFDHKKILPVPAPVIKAVATFSEYTQRKPRFTADELEFFGSTDVVPSGKLPGFDDLNILPKDIRSNALPFIRHFRLPVFHNMD